jgi:lipopolysaccharide/colanic/teichoic acid biosynthesis glycosyltransferase
MRNNVNWRRYTAGLMMADAALLGAAFVITGIVSNVVEDPDFDPLRYSLMAATMAPALVAVLWLGRAYGRHNLLGGPEEYASVVRGCTNGSVLLVGISHLYGSTRLLSLTWLLLFWIIAVCLVGAGHFMFRRGAYALRHRGWFIRRVLVAGTSSQALAIAQQLHGPTQRGIRIVGLLDDYLPAGSEVDAPDLGGQHGGPIRFRVLGHSREAQQLAADLGCDLLIVVPAALSWESQQRFGQLSQMVNPGLEVRLAPTQYDLTAVGVEPAPLGYIPMFRLQPTRITGWEAVLRAVIDGVMAALLLTIAAPAVGAALAGAHRRRIRPMFVHRRVLGLGSRPVTLTLLSGHVSSRLLVRGAPALLAVLRGDLALVGPRPVLVTEQAQYGRLSALLLAVKPGLTGPWRLTDSTTSPDESVLGDTWWVRNWTIWQHLFVLFHSARRAWARDPGGAIARWDATPVQVSISPPAAPRSSEARPSLTTAP